MLHAPAPFPALAVAAALALGGCPSTGAETETTPPSVSSSNAVADPKPAAPSPVAVVPPRAPSPLRVVAVREGPIDLLQTAGEVLVMLEGEPVPVIDGAPRRQPGVGRGITYDYDPMMLEGSRSLAFIGDPAALGDAWLTTAEEFERSGSAYPVFEHTAQGWRRVPLKRGRLAAYYAAYVERDGAWLGLKVWSSDPAEYWDETNPGYEKEQRAFRRALAKAEPAWVRLSGDARAVPRIPAGHRPFDAVTTEDGTLYALASRPSASAPLGILVWPPQDSTAPASIPMPDAPDGVGYAALWASDSAVLVTGAEPDGGPPYLAVGRGTTWERVSLDLPGRPEDATDQVSGAARTPAGELWITLDDMMVDDAPPGIWRKPPGEAWRAVPLPVIEPALFARELEWVHLDPEIGGGWARVERPPLRVPPTHASRLLWGDGGVWIVLRAHEDTTRSVLLSTAPGPASVVSLPPSWQIDLERHNEHAGSMTPGTTPCDLVSVVLDGLPAPSEQATIADALIALQHDAGTVENVYVGRRGPTEVLVATVRLDDAGKLPSLRTAAAEVTGRAATIGCDIPPLVRMVKEG